jgi:GTP pyrophosphokinase
VIRQYELVEKVRAYDPDVDEDLLNRAYVYSMKAHGAQKRASGDPYFSHPLEVAGILTGMKLDAASIATALLHDVVEDTKATLEDIEGVFGAKIAGLVDGVTKLSRLELQGESSRQAENFRKLLVAMSNDIRVLLVKLADRLHNMRTLRHIESADKRRRIALETMEIYAPLAERIGIQAWKEELEDLAFAEINPDARASVLARLEFLRSRGGNLVQRVSDQLKRVFAEAGIESWVSGREKRPFSIWRKMEMKSVSFEQLSDIMAFRVVVADVAACYQALGVVHARWPMVPGRFKDYISTPKRNGYQSIHTTVIGPEQQRIEVQIRTREMQDVAEYGVAAHWRYKRPEASEDPAGSEGAQYRWIKELLEILEHASDPEEFLEHTKLEMFQDQVFCFTPKGDLIALPRGATPVDFAYAVHSQIGNTCVGCKINGRLAPLRTRLENGDQVEILRSKTGNPSPLWETFVVTGKARAGIRRFIRQKERDQYFDLGRAIVQKAFRQEDHEASEKAIAAALPVLRLKAAEDLYIAVGRGDITGRAVVEAAVPGTKAKPVEAEKVVSIAKARAKKDDDDPAIAIKGLIPGMAINFAGCCHPLPGERIVGIVTTGRGVTVHTIDCEQLKTFADEPERWLDIAWNDAKEKPGVHVGRVSATLANEPGALSALTTIIAKNKGNISNLRIVNRNVDFFEMVVDIEVRDVRHLTNIIAALRATSSISAVERMRG